ncbi:hypothetical protein EPUL_002554, partial [Erysiphe pulchra]
RCQRCIRDRSQLRPHLRECPEANIQRIAFTPPPWQRRAFDVNQFRDLSDSNNASSRQRRPFDVNQFRDLSDSSEASSISSRDTSHNLPHNNMTHNNTTQQNVTRDNVTNNNVRGDNVTRPVHHFVDRPIARVPTSAESVNTSELETDLNEALFIPDRRKKITLGMGVRALLTGKQLRLQDRYGILVTNPLWIGDELHGDVRLA